LTGPPARSALQKALGLLKSSGRTTKLQIADIACGSGVLALTAAVQPEVSSIIASDFSSSMCAIVERKGAALLAENPSLARIRTVVADAQDLSGIESNSVDACFCVFGIMMVPDAEKAAVEMVRITRAGGLIVILTWLESSQSQFHGVMVGTHKHVAAKRAAASASSTPAAAVPTSIALSLQVPFNTLASLEQLFTRVGVKREVIETHTAASRMYDGVADYLTSMRGVAPMIGTAHKTPETAEWAKEYLSGVWGEKSKFNLHATSIIAIARKP
jgi:ubiquinone/menaquinone biosynthesis C-methylase UbiE